MDASLKEKLNKYEISLKDNLFISGSEPSYEDAHFFKSLIKENFIPCQKEYPAVWAWYSLMILFEDAILNEWLKKPSKKEKKDQKDKKEVKNKEPYICDEPDNLVDNPEYKKIIKKQINDHKGEKSNVFLEVNPVDNELDLNTLAKKVLKEIKRDGLKWGEKYEIKETVFGIKKLIMGMNVGMDTSVQDVIDQLETWEEEIQSVDFALFNQC